MPERFPVTRLSLVERLREGDAAARGRAFEAVVTAYWKPVYTYLRLWKRLGAEDAEDVTQGFFAHALQKGTLERYDPDKARFRTWIRTCLDGFLANAHKAARRQKRGGEYAHVSLDFQTAEGELVAREIPGGVDLDAFFHREWVRGIVGRAVDRLRNESSELDFTIFERYDLDEPVGGERPTYRAIAEDLRVPVTKVTNTLHAMRRRLRAAVVESLSELCAGDAELEEETRALFRGMAP